MAAAQEELPLTYTNLNPMSYDFKYVLAKYHSDPSNIDNLIIGCCKSSILYIAFCFLWSSCKPASLEYDYGSAKKARREPSYNLFRLNEKMKLLAKKMDVGNVKNPDKILQKMLILEQKLENEHFTHISREKATVEAVLDENQPDYAAGIFGLVRGADDNDIAHYFVIRKKPLPAQQYSIISSYGCDYTQIKQYETDLDLDELYAFIDELKDPVANKVSLVKFLKKYFVNEQYAVTNSLKEVNTKGEGNPHASGIYRNEPGDDIKTIEAMLDPRHVITNVTYLHITDRIKTALEGKDVLGGRPRIIPKTRRKRTRRKRTRRKRTIF